MSSVIILGSQWGDEGKGKIVDLLSQKAHAVVRFQGGANAGHTLIVDGKKVILHLIPSGILHPKTVCLLTSGVALDIIEMQTEITALKSQGYLKDDKQLRICESSHLVLPFHRTLDKAREEKLSSKKVGTTGRGIGPSYEDRASRRGILFGDLFDKKRLEEKIDLLLEEKNHLLTTLYNEKPVDKTKLMGQLKQAAEFLTPYREPCASQLVNQWANDKKHIVFEGAQGVLLDNRHGTYPFVTSSSTVAGSALTSTGLGPSNIEKVYGITKAYCTRVGAGPFPTELFNGDGEKLQEVGQEFGATTGRKRRCGWLDLVALRYAKNIAGLDALIITKLDILSDFDNIKICNEYKYQGKSEKDFPLNHRDLPDAEPQWTEFKGWKSSLDNVSSRPELPQEAQEFLAFIEDQVGIPIEMVSVGPGRDHVLADSKLL